MISTLKAGLMRTCLCKPLGFQALLVSQTAKISSTEAKPELISNTVSFRPAVDSRIDKKKRPLVFIYSWLGAKSGHIHKYGDFYLGKGFDVLHIKVDPIHILRPSKAQGAMAAMLDFVGERAQPTSPILVHGFSVGAYLLGETLVKMETNPETYGQIGKRIVGQILDSPVDFEGIPRGMSRVLTDQPLLQKIIKGSITGYMQLFKNTITKHYILSSDTFKANRLNVPGLMLYSLTDPVGTPGPIEAVAHQWESQGAPVYLKCWDVSPHVSHFHYHPVEYIEQLNLFIGKLGLTEAMDYKGRKIQN